MSSDPPPLLPLSGTVERVTYHNSENGYSVLKLKVKGNRELVTLVGHSASITPGEFVEATGYWIQHRDFGLQFQANSLKTVHPATLEGMEKYLGSGAVKGIGPHFAKKLVTKFKTAVFEIIENSPDQLKEVDGIGPVRIQKITQSWKEQKVVREIMVFLQSHGVGTLRAVRIYRTYGEKAIEQVQENPYQLARDIVGIGFKSADQIASHLGISPHSLVRARAGIQHLLQEKISEGNSAYPEKIVLEKSIELLDIPEAILKEAIEAEVKAKELYRENINETECLYPASIYHCEVKTGQELKRLLDGKPPWGFIDTEKATSWVEEKLNIKLAALQKEAIQKVLESKLTVITGGPGTGKTTLTQSILTILAAKKISVALCSPTGRASKRLADCTGLEAKTIHRLLKFDPAQGKFLHNSKNPLPIDFLILDETSMVDIVLMYQLLQTIPSKAAVLLVGDVDQIPSVGPGEVLKGILDSEKIPSIRLTEVFRQANESRIIQNAHQINQGNFPDVSPQTKDSDFHFIETNEPEQVLLKIVELVAERIPKAYHLDPIHDIQVLSPMNRGAAGARNLNLELQKALNPNPSQKIERFGFTFATHDKVMVIANDYDKEVFNGDIGLIEKIDSIEQEIVVNFEGRKVVFGFNELDILVLAYATTIHKAQGSEYPAVVIPITTQHYPMLKKKLLYTGVTRGKKLVVLVGQKKAMAIAIQTNREETRWNKLKERLQELLKPH